MVRMLPLLFLLALPGFAQAPGRKGGNPSNPANSTPKQTGTVDGSVTNSISNAPIRKAVVTLRSIQQNFTYVAVSDESGVFRFARVEPDTYVVETAEAQGFQYNPVSGRMAAGAQIAVAEDQHVTGVKVQMEPFGVITGKVVDEDGEPLRNVSVQALVYDYSRGVKVLQGRGYGETNDRGEYRIFDMVPGRYVIHAMLREAPVGPPQTHRNVQEWGYPTLYYPGSSDPSQATSTQVSPGAEVSGIDFKIPRIPAYHIRGTLVGTPQGAPRNRIQVSACGGIATTDNMNQFGATVQPDGTFDVIGILPGTWCVMFAPRNGQGAISYARETVTVTDQSVDGVNLMLQEVAATPGAIQVDGQADQPPSFGVSLQPLQPTANFPRNLNGPVKDGAFSISGATPGAYQVLLRGVPPTMYLKSIRYGSQDVSDGVVPVKGDGTSLTLVLGTDAGQLSGTVQTASGDPAASIRVTVAPADQYANRKDLMRATSTDLTGHFQVSGLAPGDYQVYAWEDLEAANLAPLVDFRREFGSRAATVTVHGNGQDNVQVKSISASDAQPVKAKFQ
jgi:hypothetical protein